MKSGLPIESFTDKVDVPSGNHAPPTQTELLIFATEMLMATLHEASDKIAAAILTAEWNRATHHHTLDAEARKAVAVTFFQGYNNALKNIRAMNTQNETNNGDDDGEEHQETQEGASGSSRNHEGS